MPLVPSFVYGISQGAAPPGIPLSALAASSSGPKRTRQLARETRRHNPLRSAKKKANSESDGWDRTLVRFRAYLDTLFNVQHGQPSGGLVPEMALAKLTQFMKEDLKPSVSDFFYCVFVHHFTNSSTWQQPLRDMKAGEGKRSRDIEIYLEGLLQAIRQADPAPMPVGDSDEYSTTVAALSRRKRFYSRFGVR